MALERFLGGGFLGEAFFGVSVAGCWIWGSIWGRLPQPFQFRIKASFKMISPGDFLEAGQI